MKNLMIAVITLVILLTGALCIPRAVFANNVDIGSPVNIQEIDQFNGTAKIVFSIYWYNSWMKSENWDAVWVFVKYSTDQGVTWHHATLKESGAYSTSLASAGFSTGSLTGTYPADMYVPDDKKGAFLYKGPAQGSGFFLMGNAKLVWDYVADNVQAPSSVRVKVFAIEMVYIPTANFYVGTGTEVDGFYYSVNNPTYDYEYDEWVDNWSYYPCVISQVGSIPVSSAEGYFYYNNTSGQAGDQLGPIPAAFPNGHDAFYLMKYEISQGQYADFLNTLTAIQSAARFSNTNGYQHYTITNTGTPPNKYSASRPYRACNYLSWADMTAYADWAALRPMTELEFEKACRGPTASVPGEYAWGNTDYYMANQITFRSGHTTEDGEETIRTWTSSDATCNIQYAGVGMVYTFSDEDMGPLRCGIFADNADYSLNPGSRMYAGAGYYGNMELSGNLWEMTVTVGNPTGRAFTGKHGDGVLTPGGNADVPFWPSANAVGSGVRGGAWLPEPARARVSDRNNASQGYAGRTYDYGGRLARSP